MKQIIILIDFCCINYST